MRILPVKFVAKLVIMNTIFAILMRGGGRGSEGVRGRGYGLVKEKKWDDFLKIFAMNSCQSLNGVSIFNPL